MKLSSTVSRMGLGSDYKTINVAHGIKDEDGTNINKVRIGHWLPEDDGLIVHRSDRVTGSIEEWLQKLIASIARQQKAQVLVMGQK